METPHAGSLWETVAAAGQAAKTATESSEAFRQANDPVRTALALGTANTAMIRALALHVAELERRLADPPLKYVGVWQQGRDYSPGSVATFNGCMWHCEKTTNLRPGEGGGWTLCVKAGRDGRDAR